MCFSVLYVRNTKLENSVAKCSLKHNSFGMHLAFSAYLKYILEDFKHTVIKF